MGLFRVDGQDRKAGLVKKIKRLFAKIQATEGQRFQTDALNWNYQTQQNTIRKNGWKDYASQIQEIRKMYYGKTDYGNALGRPGIDIRVAFLCGEGLSITGGSKKSTAKWISDFLEYNFFGGSALTQAVKLGEMEGKCLAMIKKVGDSKTGVKIKIKLVSYTALNYTVETDAFGDPVKVTWTDPKTGKEKSETAENFEYFNYAEYNDNINDSPPPIANVITQIVNYERALYDLRENNHLFGRITPVISDKDEVSLNQMANIINGTEWTIGQAILTTGNVRYLTPGTDALESLRGEMSLNLKLICAALGIPVHWMGWTDLMSNRATADTLSELVETLTKEARLKWIEFFTNLIRKAMIKSMQFGDDSKDLYGFKVELPQITAEKIKELIDAWFVLAEAGYVAKEVLINKLPGVDPEENKKALERERKEDEKNKPKAAVDFEAQLEGEEETEDNE